jgi:large conductance mechanosensitive channel
MSLIKEFRDFVGSGNAVDLAVGVLAAGAMGKILQSLVDELIIPFTGLIGKADWSNQYIILKGGDAPAYTDLVTKAKDGVVALAEARKAGVVALGYGQFLTVAVNTLVLVFAVFVVVKAINAMKKKQAEEVAAAPPPAPPAQEVLLTEIRDLLKAK